MKEPDIHIHYARPPDREDVFHQHLVHEEETVRVTLATDQVFEPAVVVEGMVVLETGSDVVWFTFPGIWHDIGRFHTADGTFRGWYANILTPPTFHPEGVWRTTDLFLDVWLPPDMEDPRVLDRDQFTEAVGREWIDEDTGRRALVEVDRILEHHAAGLWPPTVSRVWTRERALERLESS